MTDSIKYEIRQLVTLCNKQAVFMKVCEEPTEHLARVSFAKLCEKHPAHYFELIKVVHTEIWLMVSDNLKLDELDLLG